MSAIEIQKITPADLADLGPLVADFRVALKSYKGISATPDPAAGAEELKEYLDAGFPCFAAKKDHQFIGYVVCKVAEPCVWVEALYVRPENRGSGAASQLFCKAEELAGSYGENTVYNNIHPNNHAVIRFLQKHGYSVINLVEVRKPYPGENCRQKLPVGDHFFDY